MEVLGSQTLADLRDLFYCINDIRPNAQPGRSATMFVEGMFLDDMRHPQSSSLSKYGVF